MLQPIFSLRSDTLISCSISLSFVSSFKRTTFSLPEGGALLSQLLRICAKALTWYSHLRYCLSFRLAGRLQYCKYRLAIHNRSNHIFIIVIDQHKKGGVRSIKKRMSKKILWKASKYIKTQSTYKNKSLKEFERRG